MFTRAPSRVHVEAASREHSDAGSTASLSVDLLPRTVLRRLLAAVAVLTAASVAGQVLLREAPSVPLAGGIAHSLYVDSEQSLPTLFAVVLIGVVAAVLAVIALLDRRTGSRYAWYWATAAALALLLALDEYLSLHEQAIDPLREVLGSGPGGLLHYAWILPASLVVIVTAVIFVPFLRHLPTRLRNLVLLSGIIYLAGALGMEALGGAIESATGDRGSYLYVAATTCEEALELVGVSLLLYALLGHLATAFDSLTVRAGLQPHRTS